MMTIIDILLSTGKPDTAKGVHQGLREVETVVADCQPIEDAIDCSILDQISFWDALIVASAAAAQCGVLLTEALSHGQMIRGVRVQHSLGYSG
jgi:predicted nucleic acid-binding protein